MITKKIYTYLSTLVFTIASVFFSSYALAQSEKKFDLVDTLKNFNLKNIGKKAPLTDAQKSATFQKCDYVNDPIAFETIWWVSIDAQGNIWVLSHTPDGQIFLSVNGIKVYWNKNAEFNEPTAIINFSAGNVTGFDITYQSNNLLPELTINGTLWCIAAPNYAKNPKEKWLYKFTKIDGSYSWVKEKKLLVQADMVSAANDGSVVALTSDGPYQKIDVEDPWKKLDSMAGIKQIATGNKDAIFILTNKGKVYTLRNDSWKECESSKPKENIEFIAVSPEGSLFCTDKHGKAFFFSGRNDWVLLPQIWNAKQLAVGQNVIYGLTGQPYGEALLKNSTLLPGLPGKAAGIAILGSGTVANAKEVTGTGAGAAVGAAEVAAPLRASAIREASEQLKKNTKQTAATYLSVGSAAVGTTFAVGGVVMTLAGLAPMAEVVGITLVTPLTISVAVLGTLFFINAASVIIVSLVVAGLLFGVFGTFLARPSLWEVWSLQYSLEELKAKAIATK